MIESASLPQVLSDIADTETFIEMSPLEIRGRIKDLEEELLRAPQAKLPPKHHFSKGVYAREIFIPKGTLLVGKIHKFENLNIVSQGDISILTEEGVKRIKAPFTGVSKPGTKRVGYAHEDTVWIAVHATKETDLEKIEAEVIAKNFDDVPQVSDADLLALQEGE